MSGLAKILLERGEFVSGSDPAVNKQTESLRAEGATIYTQQLANNITSDIDVVVLTSAIREDNPERVAAEKLGIRIMRRSEMLNKIITEHKAIAVTGTHGKTTTSSMLMTALDAAGMDTTAIIGAEVHTISGNAKSGLGEYSVAEVCEYERAFLDIFPHAAIITNIEADHLDYYKDLEEIVDTFKEFVAQIDPEGFLIYNGESETCQIAAKGYSGTKLTYGLADNNDYFPRNIENKDSKTYFDVIAKGKNLGEFTLNVPGEHNILNSLAVIATVAQIGADMKLACEGIEQFMGAERRFQYKGEYKGATIIDDYAHHPTEIAATLAGARKRYPNHRIVAVFQPHQHSRTKLLMEDFAKAFSNADVVILPEIYAVRDTDEDIKSVSSKELAEKINVYEQKDTATYYGNLDTALEALKETIKKDDIVLTIGAGPVFQIGERLLES